jgi:hypothetical protein
MKHYALPDGRIMATGVPFVLGEFQYPSNWLGLAGSDDLAERGIAVIESPDPTQSLDEVKVGYKRRVDDDAETCRLRFITPGSGMAMTYQEKHAQAQAVQDLGIDAADSMTDRDASQQFPTLFASVGIEAPTLYACAELVIERYELFAAVSGLIESARLGGKKAISDASDAASARAAYEAITWPQP